LLTEEEVLSQRESGNFPLLLALKMEEGFGSNGR
jgi:hypothetical protein